MGLYDVRGFDVSPVAVRIAAGKGLKVEQADFDEQGIPLAD